MMELLEIKSRWNEVLDYLERENRIVWLVFFDARLVSFGNNILRLSFIDAEKLSGAHDFTTIRKSEHINALKHAISTVFGINIEIIIE